MNPLFKRISIHSNLKILFTILILCFVELIALASSPGDLIHQISCPVCELDYSEFIHAGQVSKSRRARLDGKIMGEKIPILGECPLCKGVFHQTGFQAINKNELKAFIWSDSFRNFRSADAWFRRALIIEKITSDRFQKGMAFLNSFWANETDKEIADISLEKSLKYFNEFVLLQKTPDERTMDAELKVGELLRLLSRFVDAEIHFKELKKDARFKQSFYPRLIDYELKLIAEKNSTPGLLPEGNSLHLAIKADDREKVTSLLSQKGLMNEINSTGDTPLALALKAENAFLVRLLVKNGAALGRVDLRKNTIFHFPQIFSEKLSVSEFSSALDYVNQVNSDGHTPLMLSIKEGQFEYANALLSAGANPFIVDLNGNTSIHLLAESNEESALKLCLRLQKIGASVNARNYFDETPLLLAVKNNSQSLAKTLIKLGAKVDARLPDGRTPLFFAQTKEMAEILLKSGADLFIKNNAGHSPFLVARLEGNPEKIKLYKATGHFGEKPKVFKVGDFFGSIFSAIRKGKTAQALDIINRDASVVNFKDLALGEYPLHLAILKENLEVAKALIKMGAKINLENDFGRTPVHYAAMLEDLRFLQLLISKNGDIFKLDYLGNTPLHDAARAGKVDCYDLLLKSGASPQTRNDKGESALSLLKVSNEFHKE